MSNIEKLLAQSKKVKIGETEVEVHSLDYEDLIEVSKLSSKDNDERVNAANKLIGKALKKSFPDASEEQIKRFDIRFLDEYMNALYDVSGIELTPEQKKKLSEMTEIS